MSADLAFRPELLVRGPMLANGAGGEGTVFEVAAHRSLLLKVYHKPLSQRRLARLQRVIAGGTPALTKCAAWPLSVQTVNGETLVVLPRVDGGQPIHQLYDRVSRKSCFPKADWRSLTRVAAAVAQAFATIHEAGFCVVDVSENNTLVLPDLRVMLIDCDSCVPQDAGADSISSIETPFWLAPELAGVQDRTLRAPDHDNYALARLVFLLLFEGSDPMTVPPGTEGGSPASRVFAFSRKTPLRQPLAHELRITDLPAGIATMFEEAFAPRLPLCNPRPTAADWADALGQMAGGLRCCGRNASHWLVPGQSCPWCAMAARTQAPALPTSRSKSADAPAARPARGWMRRHPVTVLVLLLALYLGRGALWSELNSGGAARQQLSQKSSTYRQFPTYFPTAPDHLSSVPAEVPRRAALCGGVWAYSASFMAYRQGFPGVWYNSGSWHGRRSTSRLCGGLIVESVTPDRLAYGIYVFALPSRAPQAFRFEGGVLANELFFNDSQGGRFSFTLYGDTLNASFLDAHGNPLTASFRRQ